MSNDTITNLIAGEMETVADIIREMRGYSHGMPPSYHVTMSWHDFRVLLDRIERAAKREEKVR